MVGHVPHSEKHQAQNMKLRACLAACAAGQAEAFSDLYALTAPKFTAILMHMVQNEAECADILQDAYLAIWKNAHRFDPEKGKPFTWMLVIMRNKGLDALRSRARSRATQTLSGELIETLRDDSPSPLDVTQTASLRQFITPYLSRLRPEIARAVTLSTFDGLSAREIGEVMHVPTNTAKSWVRRGLKRIRGDIERSNESAQIHEFI